ncbi:MAG: winged helix-turn-helix domain-containing protein [Gammaproteobacteria bacterium]|nr:winged helix-turn-helix domain-containing protein [Gammaproteobacteria bacterium]
MNSETFRAHCLLIGRDLPLRRMIAFGLRQRGHDVAELDDVRDADDSLAVQKPDLLLLDWPHADTECIDFVEAVRARHELAGMRVLIVSSRRSEDDAVRAFDSGVDDFVLKPLSTRELFARIRACLSRPAVRVKRQRLDFGDLILDPDSRRLLVGEAVIDLGRREFRLMRFLMRHPDQVFSRNELLEKLWSDDPSIGRRTIDVHVRRIRRVLEPHGCDRFLQTVRSIGYRFSTHLSEPPGNGAARLEDRIEGAAAAGLEPGHFGSSRESITWNDN